MSKSEAEDARRLFPGGAHFYAGAQAHGIDNKGRAAGPCLRCGLPARDPTHTAIPSMHVHPGGKRPDPPRANVTPPKLTDPRLPPDRPAG